jgi:hypothetical protein
MAAGSWTSVTLALVDPRAERDWWEVKKDQRGTESAPVLGGVVDSLEDSGQEWGKLSQLVKDHLRMIIP